MFRVLVLLITQTCLIYGQDILKGSLTFVIDDTGSMSNEILQVKQSVNYIFDKLTSSQESQIENFVLVTFNDPDSRLRTITNNKHEFKSALENIQVDRGGDCPEYSMSGIKLALQSSLPNSIFYVFTDASAKDFEMMEEVRNIATKNHVQVSFLLTGECSKRTDPDYQVYNDLANATYGDVYNMMKSDIKDIMNFIGERIEGRDELLAAGSFPAGIHKLPPFDIDGKMGNVTLSASGANPSIKVTDHNNDTVKTTDIVSKPEILIAKLVDPKPGTYTAEVSSSSGVSARVRAKTTINIEARFSGFKPSSPNDTTTAPSPEGNTILSIILHGEGVKLENATVFDMSGNVVVTLPLRLVNEEAKFYVADYCDPPKIFRVSVFGYDEADRSPVKRDVVTPIERQTMKFDLPKVTGEDAIMTSKDSDVVIECNVSGTPQPTITWQFAAIDTSKFVSIPGSDSVLSISNVDETHAGLYKCIAHNNVGEAEHVTTLVVKVLPKVTGLAHQTASKGSNITIQCSVYGIPRPSITWQFKAKNGSRFVTVPGSDSMLRISNIREKHAGRYKCIAHNYLGESEHVTTLTVQVLPIITGVPNKIATKSSNVEIECEVSGIPSPTITWQFKAKNGSKFERLSTIPGHDAVLSLSNIDEQHAGLYKCVAQNVLGSAEHITTLIVYVLPEITGAATTNVSKGSNIIIECNVYGIPQPKIYWKFMANDASKFVSIPGSDSVLRVSNVEEKHAGRYKCIAYNIVGEVEHVTTLIVRGNRS